MATTTHTITIDDLDGTEGDDVQPVIFAADGRTYQIDLSARNRDAFIDALKPYLAAARPFRGTNANYNGRRVAISDKASADQRQRIRAWARENGYAVGTRGRIPAEVVFAYPGDSE